VIFLDEKTSAARSAVTNGGAGVAETARAWRKPLRYETLTGLRYGQLQELAARIMRRGGDVVREGGRPAAIGLFKSVAMVVTLMRKNLTQEVAGAVFGVSQATVSRRWDLLRPLIGDVLAGFVLRPEQVAGVPSRRLGVRSWLIGTDVGEGQACRHDLRDHEGVESLMINKRRSCLRSHHR
jgi:hypothetical protein